MMTFFLVGGFNPSEKYYVLNWIISPGRGENKKSLKPPPSFLVSFHHFIQKVGSSLVN